MILVTGGTGYVGSRLAQRLVEQGRPVRLLVRDIAEGERKFPIGVECARGDVTEPETLLEAMAGVETVIHLVAILRERGDRTFEKASGLGWTIFRPSIIFGPGDQFFFTLAGLAKLPAPFVLPECGTAHF